MPPPLDPSAFSRCPGSGLPSAPMHRGPAGLPSCSQCPATFVTSEAGDSAVPLPEHVARLGASAQYAPRMADLHENPLLHACFQLGLAEEQVIDVLVRQNRELRARLVRALETRADPVYVVMPASAKGEKD